MAQKSYFFNSAPGDRRTYQAADFARYFGSVLTSGIMPNPETGDIAALTPGEYGLNTRMYANLALGLQVVMGNAIIRGYRYELDSPHDIAFRPQSSGDVGYDRIDRIVLRLDLSNHKRSIELAVVEGNTAINPVPPALTRNYNVYELSLARVRVRAGYSFIDESDVVDERADETVCGFANSLITVPTSVFQQQFDAWFENYQTSAGEDFRNWTEYQKLDVATWVNHFKDEVMDANDEYQTWVNALKASTSADTTAWQNNRKAQFDTWQSVEQRDFNAWIDSLKDNLGEAVAEDIKLEVEAARVDGETGEVFENVPARLDVQNAKTKKKIFNSFSKSSVSTPQTRKNFEGCVALVDDDLHPNAYSFIFNEIVKVRGIPYSFAAIPSRIVNGDPGSIDERKFDEMNEHELVEMLNHTNTHPNLATLSESEIIEEIEVAETWLREKGVYTRTLVPPFGGINDDVRKHIKKYCDTILITYNTGGTSNLNCADGAMLNSDAVRRVEFSLPLDDLKTFADLAKQHNAVMVLSSHAGYPNNPSATQNFVPQKLHDFIDYCQSIGLPFKKWTDAYDAVKNVVEHRDAKGNLLAGISANGDCFNLTSKDFYVSNTLKSLNDAPRFALGAQLSTVKRSYNSANASLHGYPGAGQLTTFTGGDYGYTYELYQPLRTAKLLFRAYNDQTQTWSEFVDIASTQNLRGTLTFGATQYEPIPNGEARRITITANGVKSGDSVTINPNGIILPSGVIVGLPYVQDGQIVIPILNMSGADFSVNGTSWVWRAIRTLN